MYRWENGFRPFKGLLTDVNLDVLVKKAEMVEGYHAVKGVNSQLKPKEWLNVLTKGSGVDPDIHFILDGVLNGFRVVDIDNNITGYCCKNYLSCYFSGNKEKLDKLISSEILSGKLTKTDKIPKCTHALGVVKKKDSSKIRPITDCRMPLKKSVNNYMVEVVEKFQFVQVDTVVQKLLEGKYFMSTLDLSNAYRSVMIHEQDRQYFGLEWDGHRLVDNFLCFGCKSAPFIFNRLTDSICRYLRDVGVTCYNYLDDIICLSESYEQGVQDQLLAISVLRRVGFYIAWEKVNSPSQKVVYLGIELNTVDMYMKLPEAKIEKILKELAFWKGKKKATLKQLQVLSGILGHAARVIRGGKLYIHFLLGKLSEAREKKRVKLDLNFHEDLQWWKYSATVFNNTPLYNIYSEGAWLSMFCELGSVRVTSYEFECVVKIKDFNDSAISYTRKGSDYELYIPFEFKGDDVSTQIGVLWMFCMENVDLVNCSLVLFCNRKMLWLALKKKRHKSLMTNMVLRNIFWWSMLNNVNLVFLYSPFESSYCRCTETVTW